MKAIAKTLNIPQRDLDLILGDGFYVRINKHYTATVRSLKQFIELIEGGEEIGDNFGEITSESKETNNNFYHYLIKIIGHVKGFPVFNSNKHTFIKCEGEKETISIITKSGKKLTVAIMDNGANCVDVALHNSGLESIDNGGTLVPQFEIIGLSCGQTPVKKTPITVAVIDLGEKISS